MTFHEHDSRACSEYVMSGRAIPAPIVDRDPGDETPEAFTKPELRLLADINKAVALGDLPWMRRERIDSHTRRAIYELRSLSLEEPVWASTYGALADTFEAAANLIQAVEDLASMGVPS